MLIANALLNSRNKYDMYRCRQLSFAIRKLLVWTNNISVDNRSMYIYAYISLGGVIIYNFFPIPTNRSY